MCYKTQVKSCFRFTENTATKLRRTLTVDASLPAGLMLTKITSCVPNPILALFQPRQKPLVTLKGWVVPHKLKTHGPCCNLTKHRTLN